MDGVYYHRDSLKCDYNCSERCATLAGKRKKISDKVNSLANKFDTLLAITKPNTRYSITEDEVTEVFNYLRSELKRVERKVKKDKQPFTLAS